MIDNELKWWYEILLPYMSAQEFAGGVEGLKNFMRVFGRAYVLAANSREDIPITTTTLLETVLDMLESLIDKEDNDDRQTETLGNTSEMD